MENSYEVSRQAVACFEVAGGMGLKVSGDGAEAWLNGLFTKDIEMLPPFKGAIGLFVEDNGDLIAVSTIFRDEDDSFFVFADQEELSGVLKAQVTNGVYVSDIADTHRVLGILGPKAQDMMSDCAGEDILGIPYMSFEKSEDQGYVIFRQGFTGEFEFRILIENGEFAATHAELLAAAVALGGGAIETEVLDLLCLEMRSIKDDDILGQANPLEAGLHWMVEFSKENYRGKAALDGFKMDQTRKSLIVKIADPLIAQAGDTLEIEGKNVGVIARVIHSPTLKCDVAFAYLDTPTGWVGVDYDVASANGSTLAKAVSSPLFVTQTVLDA